jgi:glycosyltransferase involved in cell wall biosynthesis
MLDGPNSARLRASGAVVHDIGWHEPFDPLLFATLMRLVRSTRATVIQTWMRRMDVVAGLTAAALRRPWVYSERSNWEPSGWRDRLRLRAIDSSAAIVANSHAGARFWQQRYGKRKPVYVVSNALPCTEIGAVEPASRASLGIAPEQEIILFVGRFDPLKNVELLAETLVRTLRRRPLAVACLCGLGPEELRVRSILGAANLIDRCHFLGYRTDVWSIMKTADVFLSTSRIEGQPNAVLEAMAAGCPLALSDIPEHREIIDESGAIFFAHTAEEAASAVARVLDDSVTAHERIRHARQAAAGFSIDSTSGQYAAVYELLAA